MRVLDRAEELVVTSSRQFVLDRLSHKAAPVPFEPNNPLDQLGGQRDGDALHFPHRCSMTYSMIISNGVDIAAGSPSRRTGEQRRQRSRQLSDGARPRGW